jgi:DNA modification methylase
MIHNGDCIEVMATFEPDSIDAIVTDPPYGLEFMGKAWDKLDDDLPQAERWKDKRSGGSSIGTDDRHPASRSHVAYGGKRSVGKRCQLCGKRSFSGSPCVCPEPVWVFETAEGAPPSALLMQRWHERWAREAFRVAKPGAHLLAFGGTRTYHRLAAAIEDAGWEIRDTLVWAYASGFPKSLDVSKAIDKAAGAEREVVGPTVYPDGTQGRATSRHFGDEPVPAPSVVTAPATDLAREWQGWGTALKPAWEPIVLARKPLRGTVAGNVTEYGTGALNIDGCRIRTDDNLNGGAYAATGTERADGWGMQRAGAGEYAQPAGRWPANVILTDPIFDGDTPGVVGGGRADGAVSNGRRSGNGAMFDPGEAEQRPSFADSGTYSRFFLVPKSSRSDREPIVEPRCNHWPGQERCYWCDLGRPERNNVHPTVKPTDLMRHLVRLVTPPGGVVLDPFLGSGTTAIAAELEGFAWVGIEREAEYVAIAEARLNGTQRGLGLAV